MRTSTAYRKYIRSDGWRRKRAAALRYYGRRCQICGSPNRLEVHHITYERLFNEDIADLRVLCHKHHQEITKLHWKMGKRTPGVRVYNRYKKLYQKAKSK